MYRMLLMSDISSSPSNVKRRNWVTYLVTSHTLQPIPILALEQVHNKTIISLFVNRPFLLRSHLGR